MNRDFEMIVEDIFHFADGRTVFTGIITDGPGYIQTGRCELLFDGASIEKFTIEGEMIPSPQRPGGLRSISTKERITVPSARPLLGRLKLKSI
jgi:hypothetical protein